jgi:hypothetical protein
LIFAAGILQARELFLTGDFFFSVIPIRRGGERSEAEVQSRGYVQSTTKDGAKNSPFFKGGSK